MYILPFTISVEWYYYFQKFWDCMYHRKLIYNLSQHLIRLKQNLPILMNTASDTYLNSNLWGEALIGGWYLKGAVHFEQRIIQMKYQNSIVFLQINNYQCNIQCYCKVMVRYLMHASRWGAVPSRGRYLLEDGTNSNLIVERYHAY